MTPSAPAAHSSRGDQLSRQWRLLQLIDRPAGITVDDAVSELDCHRRTIRLDLRVLQDAGFPLYDEKAADGYRALWRLSPEFRANLPLKLTLAEIAALVMSRDLLAPLGASALGPSVAGAFEKIGRVRSKDAVQLLDRGAGGDLRAPARPRGSPRKPDAVRPALHRGRPRGVLERLDDVLALQIRVSSEDLLDRGAVGDLTHDHRHWDSHAADARPSTHDSRIERDAIQRHVSSSSQDRERQLREGGGAPAPSSSPSRDSGLQPRTVQLPVP